ncbi:MAG: FecR domain-containing protein [Bacteroidota bacterium]
MKSIEEISTDFGELKTITLSDGSIVKLNANSILKFNQDWQKGEEREIWLEGEAYFNVIHTKQNTPFKVYANGMEVRVLGTEFNVYGRENMAKVVLEEGAIKLKTSSSQQSLRLEPGDMVTFNTKNLDLRKDRVDTRLHTSWKDRKLVFSKTSLMKLSDIMKENFDLDFFFIDANLAKKEFTGVIPSDNKDILIQSLSEAFNIDVEVRGKTVILRSKSDEKSKYQ